MSREKNVTWDLRNQRIETLGEIVEKLRRLHYRARKNKEHTDIKSYKELVFVLYFEIDSYVNDSKKDWNNYFDKELEQDVEQLFELIEEDIESTNYEPNEVIKSIQTIDKAVNRARIDQNLDIPSQTEPNPNNAFIQGLGDN